MAATGAIEPVADAARHLSALADAVGLDGARPRRLDLEALASARPDWPTWPSFSLATLVGPPAVVARSIDLRWLHRFDATTRLLDTIVAELGGPGGGPSGVSLLVERAAMLGHRTWGSTSAGTSCRLLACSDGWVAVNLPRAEDLDSVPAWMGLLDAAASVRVGAPDATPDLAPGVAGDDVSPTVWHTVAAGIRPHPAHIVVDAAHLLGLAVAACPPLGATDRAGNASSGGHTPGAPERPLVARLGPVGSLAVRGRRLRVVDLSSLWAGPLCGWYLARAGAEVCKVESTRRPDGARAGTPAFWRRLNATKTLVELDLTHPDGVAELRRLVAGADVVIEASRPRAMADFGIDAADTADRGGIWCSITGYGRTGPHADQVAFGDDAAVAGGLVADTGAEPWFIGDAAADPISGVTAALAVTALWSRGRAGQVDVSMADAVARLTGGNPVRCTP